MDIKKTVFYRVLRQIYFITKRVIPQNSASAEEYNQENKKDRENNTFYNSITESAIKEFKTQKGVFNDFSLAESSVRAFCYHLLMQKQSSAYHICEFGGGQSTIFWDILSNYVGIKVTTYEHDPEWAKYLQERIINKDILIRYCKLMQVEDDLRERMFSNPSESIQVWDSSKHDISPDQFKNPTLRGAFYNLQPSDFPKINIDAIVLDGPHGNGRSICFPVFFKYIKPGTLILVDDYHHYPFLDDLKRLFKFDILEERRYQNSNKGWVVLRIV
ncbi:hypothetical protein [Aquirufa sp.]|jgi:hypothetical protein|uniref:hypothetical protein n=1 Tax=Aquirufa sp. TaxID=2676249 RepID=UPI0037C0385A